MKKTVKHLSRRVLAFVLTIVMLSTLIVPEVITFTSSAAQYARGDLTESNTSTTGTINHISTAKQLAQLMYRVWKDGATFSGYTYVLDNDIDMRGANALTGFSLSNATSALGQITDSGSFTRPNADYGRFDKSDGTVRTFAGVLDGQGHTISGLCFYKNSGGGAKWQGLLFDRLQGTVKNVRIIDSVGEWDQPKSDSDSALGLIGGVTSGGLVENVVVESSVYLISKRNTSGNYLQTIGGICGWVDGGTLRNCASFATVVSCTGQGALTYPLASARVQIGGVVGAIESTSTVTNCIGYGTYYSNVPERGLLAVTESYSNPGWNFASPAYLGEMSKKTISNLIAGKTTTAPAATGWAYLTEEATYVPTYIAQTFYADQIGEPPAVIHIANDEPIANFADADGEGSSYTISNLSELQSFATIANNYDLTGKTFKLTADITFNSNFDATATQENFNNAPTNVWTPISGFKGTFDGQGHKITGLYSLYNHTANANFTKGGLFNTTNGATIKNLVITNSFFGVANTSGSGSENRVFGGMIGEATNTIIQNVFFDAEVYYKTDVARAFGGVAGKVSGDNGLTITNFVFNGTFAQLKTYGTYSSWINGSTPTGLITGHGNNKPVVLTNVLLSATVGVPASNMGSSTSTRVHWGNGSVTETGVYTAKQTGAITGWTYNSALASYIPTSYAPATPLSGTYTAKTRTNASMAMLDSRDNGSYLIENAADLKAFNSFATTINCAGKTFKLTADIDLNSGWNATVTIDDEGVVHFPSQPSYVWQQIDNFYGVLDGQGHQISGLYRYATALGDSGTAGGMFLNLVGATVKNLAITNSFFAAQRTGWGSQNQKFGGLARSIQGTTTIENLFFNAEVWFNTDVHRTAGMLAAEVVNDGANLTLNNVILAGRFGVCKYSNSKIETTSGSSAKGVIAGNGNSKTITLNQVLVVADITLDAVKDNGTKTEKTVHYGPGGMTGLDTLYYGFQKNPISGWVVNDALASYAPMDLTADYVILVEDAPISQFNDKLKPGSSFIITSYQDLLNFMTKINASSGKGAGYTFKLTTDVDLNPGWCGKPTIDGTKTSGSIAFPSAPDTIWQMPRFDGTFDGQGHYIAGLYRALGSTNEWSKHGGFADELYGATIKNLKLVNSLVIANSSKKNTRFGGLTGMTHTSNGVQTTIQNVYLDVNVWMGNWTYSAIGGILGQAADAVIIKDCTFVGTVGTCAPTTSGDTLQNKTLSYPSSTTGVAIGQVLGDPNVNSVVSNIVCAGYTYFTSSQTRVHEDFGTGCDSQRTLPDNKKTNVFVGRCETVSAGTLTSSNNPTFVLSEDLGFLVTQQNYDMGLADLPDGSATTQSIQEFLNGAYNPGSIFTIATPGDLLYAAQLSQQGYTFKNYTLKLTANIDLNPGWNAKITVDGSGNPTIPAMPPVLFPGFKEFRGTLDGDNHYISGIAMYKIFIKNDNLGFVEYLYGNIVNVKFNNGLIFAQTKNYNQSDSKIGGIAARVQSASARLENLYVDLNVWYRSGSAHRIGGIAAKTEYGAVLKNIKFVGVVGTMKFEGEGGTVPSQSTDVSLSQLVADGNWKSALYITNCTMAGTVYVSASATKPTNTEISSNINATNVSGTGTATVTGSAYSNSTSPFSILPSAYGATADSKTANYESSTLTKTYYYQQITRAQFTSYINALKSAGYTEMQNYSIGDSVYYLLQNGVYTVYASRIPCNGYTGGEKHRARVYVEPYGRDYNTNKASTAKSSACQAQLWQLNVDNWYSKSSGGACYVMRLTDGRFLIVDSGFGSTYEADNIYKILYENNVRDGEPVIAGWFFTHTHEDHVKGFQRFTAEGHGADVIIEAFYVNFPSHEVVALEGEGDDLSQSSVNATMVSMTAYPDAKIYKVHSGMSFGFADATVTILYTHEDAGQSYWSGTTLYQNQLYNGNDSGMIFQVKIGDEKILFTGDAYKGADNAVYYTYPASSYASKFVTVSHHGYEGLSKAFYQAVAPSVALWPMDVARFQQDGTPYSGTEDEFSFYYRYNHTHSGNRMWEANNYFKSTSSVKEVIPAYENACLTLPYTAKTYSGGSKTINLTTAYNNKVANPDGAGGSGVTINEWYDAEAEELHISSRKDLFDFMKAAQKGRTFAGQTIVLEADIAVNPSWSYNGLLDGDGFFTEAPDGLSKWQPIPNFAGTFDGNGYMIRNLYVEVEVSGNNNYYGGIFKSVTAGAEIKNLIVKNSAMVARFPTTQGTSSNKIGGFVGRIYPAAGKVAKLTNLYIDLDVYYISGGCAALAGLVGTVAQTSSTVEEVTTYTTAQFNISSVVYAGDVVCCSANGQASGLITLLSGQHMYGPYGAIGLSTAPNGSETGLTRRLTDFVYSGTLYPVANSGETLWSGTNPTGSQGLADITRTRAYGSSAAAAEATPDGWVNNAKFGMLPSSVDEMVSAVPDLVQAQQSSTYTPQGRVYVARDLRFVGILDGVLDASELSNYSKVGMRITTEQNGVVKFTKDLDTTVVYESVWSGETLYSKDDANGFLYAFTIKAVPVTADMVFRVTTYYELADTTIANRLVYNDEVVFTYNNGLQAND